MVYLERYILYFDGASRHNPHGPAGCGWIMYQSQFPRHMRYLTKDKAYLGHHVSSNQAEYRGLIHGLECVHQELQNSDYCPAKLIVRGDSEIVIRQMRGEYQVRNDNIQPLYQEACRILDDLDQYVEVTFEHVKRDYNRQADKLANQAIDGTNHW